MEDAVGRRAAFALRAGRDGEIAIDDNRIADSLGAGVAHTEIHVQFRHAGLDLSAAPGMADLGGLHTAAQERDLVGVFLAAHVRDGVDERGAEGIVRLIVNAEALVRKEKACLFAHRVYQGQPARPGGRRLGVVPFDDVALVYVSGFDGRRQTIVMKQRGMSIRTDQQVAAKPRTQAKRIHPEVSEIAQVNRVIQQEARGVRLRIKPLPQTLAPLPATFGSEHEELRDQGNWAPYGQSHCKYCWRELPAQIRRDALSLGRFRVCGRINDCFHKNPLGLMASLGVPMGFMASHGAV